MAVGSNASGAIEVDGDETSGRSVAREIIRLSGG